MLSREMTIFSRLAKPHYLYRPAQILRRARLGREPEPVVQTPWGCPMLVSQADAIGAGIARMGVHELAVTETMWRLAGGDALALDVGANVGYFTGMLAQRAERVVALEPNPRLRRFIVPNIERCGLGGHVTLETRAASDREGTATLHLPADFDGNYGVATLATDGGEDAGAASYEIETVRLDEVIGGRAVGVLKLDVEGHELTALRGAVESLQAGLIRDVVFEDHQPPPSPVFRILESMGFSISGIEERLTGPQLIAADRAPRGWDAPTYIATRDAGRTSRLMGKRGWHCLRPAKERQWGR
jgi:FkbM family methyltransferase